MASNHEFQMVSNLGWMHGFPNLFAKENHRWWMTRYWLAQAAIWLVLINGLWALIYMIGTREQIGPQATDIMPAEQIGLTIFLKLMAYLPVIGVAILGLDAVIPERQSGTAAWVLSKPASRTAFVLSKLTANSLGVLVIMVLLVGAVAYAQIWLISGKTFPVLPYAGALGLIFLNLLFYLTLTFMLGTVFNSRGAVIGVPLLLLFFIQMLVGIVPWLGEIMPWNLTIDLKNPALSFAVALGQPLPTLNPVIATFLWCLLFVGISVWWFNREEF